MKRTLRFFGTVVVPLLAAFLAGLPARAANPTLQVKLDPNKNVKYADAEGEVLLRPNVEQNVYFAVQYPDTEKKPRAVKVELVAGGKAIAGKTLDGKDLVLKPGDIVPVSFGKPKPPPMPMAKPMPPELAVLKGPPFPLTVRLLAPAAKQGDPDVELQTVVINRVMLPQEFLKATSTYNFEEGKLTVDVTADDNFSGPASNVELVLPKDRLPEMINPANQSGQFKAKLEKAGGKASLFVENLRFRGKEGGSLKGMFYLRVDGYDRAFIIQHDFGKKTGVNTGNANRDPSLRLRARSVAVSGEPYPFQLEVDYAKKAATAMPSPDDVRIEIGLYRDEDMKTSVFKEVKGPSVRDQKVLYSPDGADGALILKPDVRDWALKDVATEGIEGLSFLRIRLIDKAGKVVEWQGPEGKEPLAVVRKVNFYKGEIPSPVVFVSIPKKASPGEELTFKVKANDEFKIKEAKVFFGKLPMTKMPPPDAESLVRVTEGDDVVWTAKLSIPEEDKSKKKIVTVVAKGLFADGTEKTVETEISFPVEKPAPVKPGGKIKAVVFLQKMGDAFPSAALVLTLYEMGKAPREVKTAAANGKGEFLFDGLDPGKYVVSCKHPNDGKMKGAAEVTVEIGKTADAVLVVKRGLK